MPIPTLADIQSAHKLIESRIHKTPVLTSTSINALASSDSLKMALFFKCENMQRVGGTSILH
jgi:threonine dehydratase